MMFSDLSSDDHSVHDMSASLSMSASSSSPSEGTCRRDADPPFNERAADTILQSSDGVDFYAFRNILSLASPFFCDLLRKGNSDSESVTATPLDINHDRLVDERRVVDVVEDASTIDSILRFCYPIRRPILTGLKSVQPVLDAAHKYDMIAVLSAAKPMLKKCIDEDVLAVFAIAIRCELYDVCTKAAKRFVTHPFLSLDSPELARISASQYHKLLQYHHHFSKDPSAALSPEMWAPDERSTIVSQVTPEAPFNNKDTADVILRSSDGVSFYVYKCILSLASPFFKDMFSLPQSASSTESLPIIDVAEDASTVNFVLSRCYPLRPPHLPQLSSIRRALEAGRKYDIDVVVDQATSYLLEWMDKDALGVFAVACCLELRDVCVKAARQSLQYPLAALDSTELGCISARQYHIFLQYYQCCCKDASALTTSNAWYTGEAFRVEGSPFLACDHCQAANSWSTWKYAPSQAWTYLERAGEALRCCPHPSAVLKKEVVDAWTPSVIHCSASGCGQTYLRDQLSQTLASKVEEAIAKVEVPSFF